MPSRQFVCAQDVPSGEIAGSGLTPAEFAARLDPLGPFGPSLAVAVSGGADSMALALLTRDFAAARGISVVALIVDHGLRDNSAEEAALAARRLAGIGIASHGIRLAGLRGGAGVAARARDARYGALAAACRGLGIVHLLLGHHARDQAETVLMRQAAGSGPAGMAAMSAWRGTAEVCLLRPLLGVAPGRLRATLRQAGLGWSEDPSNSDQRALRTRLRAQLDDADGDAPGTLALVRQAVRFGLARAASEARVAATLAERVTFHPEGFATLTAAPIEAAALAVVLQAVSGAAYQPPPRQVARLAASPGPATLAGVRLLPAGRLASGRLLVVREAAMQAPPCPAQPGMLWDGRFRLTGTESPPDGATLGALGPDARLVRRWSTLPDAVLQCLPAVRLNDTLFAVPHIGYPVSTYAWRLAFSPLQPASVVPWIGS
jgi:tRNA(Ile)-lysidine synthase